MIVCNTEIEYVSSDCEMTLEKSKADFKSNTDDAVKEISLYVDLKYDRISIFRILHYGDTTFKDDTTLPKVS